ncbi:flavin-dependent oxidoreductase [Streptomyces sp. NPDC096193]|uniref:flavin-dependent oxidoreductase n=1 Tax=Streptomyces sp. NPDC096193 TaxID=3155821 RepID=UPI0033226ADF
MGVDVLVAGAGIGGLTTALALHRAGIPARLVEAVAELRPIGVGINLLPHAVGELTALGLGDALAQTAVPIAEMAHFDRHGNRIWSEPRGLAQGHPRPQYALHRGELQTLLYEAVRDRLGADAVRTGTALDGFTKDADGLRLTLRSTVTGARTTDRAEALIGADGLHSRARALLHPGEQPLPLWNGIRMWRGTVRAEPFLGGRTMAIVGSNATAKLVVYPISRRAEEHGEALLNWVCEVRVAQGGPVEGAAWNRTGRLADVLAHYADWKLDRLGLDVPAMLAATEEILEYPMADRDPLTSWGRGRVTLLGDAAHPMYPIGSNGGSQAVLDARALARALTSGASVPSALRAYESERAPLTGALVRVMREMPADRLLQAVAERAPDGFERVEDVLTAEELASIDAAYRRTSGPGDAGAGPSHGPGRHS